MQIHLYYHKLISQLMVVNPLFGIFREKDANNYFFYFSKGLKN